MLFRDQYKGDEGAELEWTDTAAQASSATVPDRVKNNTNNNNKKNPFLYLQKGQVGPSGNLRKTID